MEIRGRKRIVELVESDFQNSIQDITEYSSEYSTFKYVNIVPYSESEVLVYEAVVDKTHDGYKIRHAENLPMIKYFIISAGTGDGIGGVFYHQRYLDEKLPEIVGFYCFSRQKDIIRELLKNTGFNHYFYSSCFDAGELLDLNSVLHFVVAGEKMGFLQTVWEKYDSDIFDWLYYDFRIRLRETSCTYESKPDTVYLSEAMRKDKGYRILVESEIADTVPDSNGKSMSGYLGISKDIISKCLIPVEDFDDRWDSFQMIKELQKSGATPEEIVCLMSNIISDNNFHTKIQALWELIELTGNDIKKMIRYLHNIDPLISRALAVWSDYTYMGNECNLNLSLPEDFWKAHDSMVRIYNTEMYGDGIDITCVSKSLEKYSFSKNGYTIRPAANTEELYDESRNLHHCVSSYAKRMLLERSYVFFLRKDDKPGASLYTIELSGDCKTLRQLKGKYNNTIPMNSDDPIRDTVNSWCEKFDFTCTE